MADETDAEEDVKGEGFLGASNLRTPEVNALDPPPLDGCARFTVNHSRNPALFFSQSDVLLATEGTGIALELAMCTAEPCWLLLCFFGGPVPAAEPEAFPLESMESEHPGPVVEGGNAGNTNEFLLLLLGLFFALGLA